MDQRTGILGWGNQAKAWAMNLKESGWEVTVFLRPGSRSFRAAEEAGFDVRPTGGSFAPVDHLAVLIPDDAMPAFFRENARDLASLRGLIFAHGFALHYRTVPWPKEADWVLVAPKGIATAVRGNFLAGGGVPAVLAVENDATGDAWGTAEAIAEGLGCTRAGLYRATAREEVEADLFSEQALLTGGLPALVAETYDVLVKAGIRPEVAYLECVHELKFIVDLIQKHGIHGMLRFTSPTARFGGIQGGKRLVSTEVRAELERILADIRSGAFRRELSDEARTGFAVTREALERLDGSPVETVGRDVRRRMGTEGT